MGFALRALATAIALAFLAALPLQAEERVTLGWGRFLNNDSIGEARDRWQTGSYAISQIRGVEWSGVLPDQFGEIIELRAEGRVIAPEYLVAPDPTDRRFVGIASFGAYSHFKLKGWDTLVGVDLVMVGPQTGMSGVQAAIHDALSLPKPTVFGNQLGNAVYPTLVFETGRDLALAPHFRLRPFVEVQAGAESFVRAGGDFVLGSYGKGALMLRDRTTGQRYIGVKPKGQHGLSLTFGGDVARMLDSKFFPAGGAAQLRSTRERVRAGVNWQSDQFSIFYGLTYLGREFQSQPEGQMVGSLNVKFRY